MTDKPSWRNRIADTITGGALTETSARIEQQGIILTQTRTALDNLWDAYIEGPYRVPPSSLLNGFREQSFDPAVIEDMINMMQYDVVGGIGYGVDTARERERAVQEARRLFKYSPLFGWAVGVWTSFGLGEKVEITPTDEAARPIWDEFATADRNEPVMDDNALHDSANMLKVTGNRFYAIHASEVDGTLTIRRVRTEEITEIITHPEDDQQVLFYKRTWTPRGLNSFPREWYYPDWRAVFDDMLDRERPERTVARLNDDTGRMDEKTLAGEILPPAAKRADKMFANEGTGTVIFMFHIADNLLDEDSLYGWPISTDAAPWLRAVQRFFEARLAVVMSKAQYSRRLTTAGGSRAVAAVQAASRSGYQAGYGYENNPPPAPGSEDIINKSLSVEELPMSTGAGDARADGEMLIWMALLGLGLFPHYAGVDTQRYATVAGMEKPLLIQFTRYQTFWSTQFRKLVRIVLEAQNRWNDASFDDFSAEVSIDKLVENDLKTVVEGLGQLFRDVLNPNVEIGTISGDAVKPAIAFTVRQVAQALGAGETSIGDDETFGIGAPAESVRARAILKLAEMVEDGALTTWEMAQLFTTMIGGERPGNVSIAG